MRTKAIQDLAQLPDAELFEQLGIGLGHCLKNALRIEADAIALSGDSRQRGADILRLAAQEEAAKVLILLDAVRCPRREKAAFSRQLQYFNQHLAKGIYAEYCSTRPATFKEIRDWVDFERREYFLDGPNGVDWIYYNDILNRREGTIYVDYVENDGSHRWVDPMKYEDMSLSLGLLPNSVLRVANALAATGCLSSAALPTIADAWRDVHIPDDFTWMSLREINRGMLERLSAAGLRAPAKEEEYATVVNEWLFPLWGLDLTTKKVDKNDLREIQGRWNPDGDQSVW